MILDGVPARASRRPRAHGGSALAVSSGLLGVATPAELEGVVAHELAHLRARDVLPQTIVSVLAAAIVESSRIGGYFQRAFLFVLGPLAASFVHLVLSPKREYDADLFAAELCGRRTGSRMRCFGSRRDGGRAVPGEPGDGAALHGQPVRRRGARRRFNTHPPLGRRVQRLRELDPDGARSSAPPEHRTTDPLRGPG